jgi:hypothetical protein
VTESARTGQGIEPPADARAQWSNPDRRAHSAPRAAAPATIRFEDKVKESGIRFHLKNSSSPQRYSIETMLGGVAVFDYNNDGLPDIFFTNGAAIPSLEKSDPSFYNRLYCAVGMARCYCG